MGLPTYSHYLTELAFSPAKEQKQDSLSQYSPYPKDTQIITDYKKTGKEHEDFKTQCYQLMDLLETWGVENKCSNQAVTRGLITIKHQLFLPEYSGNQSAHYFESIKKNLEIIVITLQHSSLPFTQKKNEYIKLCTNLAVCAPGIHGHIEEARKSLQETPPSLTSWLSELRINIVSRYASEYINRRKIPQSHRIHIMNAFNKHMQPYWNILPQESQIEDPFIVDCGIKDSDYEDLKLYCDDNYSPAAIYKCIDYNVYLTVKNLFTMYKFNINKENAIENRNEDYNTLISKISTTFESLGISFKADELCEFNEYYTHFKLKNTSTLTESLSRLCLSPAIAIHQTENTHLALAPTEWFDSKMQDEDKFDFSDWLRLPKDKIVSALFHVINNISDEKIELLLDKLPITIYLEIMTSSVLRAQYQENLVAMRPKNRSAFIEDIMQSKLSLENLKKSKLVEKITKQKNAALFKALLESTGFSSIVLEEIHSDISLLHKAITDGDIEIIKIFLKYCSLAYLNAQDKKGLTPLHYVVAEHSDNKTLLSEFLRAGVDPNIQDVAGMTPIMYLSGEKDTATFALLAQNGADLNMQDNTLKTILHQFIQYAPIKTIETLLSYPINLDIMDHAHYDAFDYANLSRTKSIIDILLRPEYTHHLNKPSNALKKLFNTMDVFGNTVLHDSIKHQEYTKARKLIHSCNVNINIEDSSGNTPAMLLASIRNEGTALLKDLVSYDIVLNQQNHLGETALHIAMQNHNIEAIRLLLSLPVDLTLKDKYGHNAFDCIIPSNTADDVIRLFQKAPLTPLEKSSPALKQFLNRKCKTSGETPLIEEIRNGYHDSAILLVKSGMVDVNVASDTFGDTPLMWAASSKSTVLIHELISAGADTAKQDTRGYNAMDWAVKENQVHAIQALLQHSMELSIKPEFTRLLTKTTQAFLITHLLKKYIHAHPSSDPITAMVMKKQLERINMAERNDQTPWEVTLEDVIRLAKNQISFSLLPRFLSRSFHDPDNYLRLCGHDYDKLLSLLCDMNTKEHKEEKHALRTK